ncbi:hypothetical protein BESEP2_00012 [Staphylococcus phage vB_SepS_BE02]|uniref:HNH endonuclease n=1 Tax=Staphylococcus phage CF9 TaxID=3113741 RepID=A0AAX4J6G6_9CAUD|nr:hypothetical protein BESEP2_00012 [Staphylococcus phage vB_SepS_BE02]WRW34497.1 HNH endonuclease [Staphylococcus phage CF9]
MILLNELLNNDYFKGYGMTNDGEIFSFKCQKSDGKSFYYYISETPQYKLKTKYDERGYITVKIKQRTLFIHRLVAIAFIPNTDNKPQVNHINGIKDDNRIENLEWVTNRENREHAIKNNLLDNIPYGVGQYDLEGNLINVFDTCKEALEHLNIKGSSGNIGRCIKGKRKTAYGYIWKSI